MTYLLFNLLLLPLYGPLFLYTLWRRYGQKKTAAAFRGQWGNVPSSVTQTLHQGDKAPVIWIHAVSVGEQMAARPIARALKSTIPACRIALSCTTDTGFQTAQAALKSADVDAVFFYPLDVPWAIQRTLNAIRPDVFLAVETELWPNFLHLARARGVLCFLVNGRVSDKLQSSAPRWAWLWRWMLSNLEATLMRSPSDATRMEQLCSSVGVPGATSKVRSLGDVKLDGVESSEENAKLRHQWRDLLGIGASEVLWVCGSTHPAMGGEPNSEEELALEAFATLANKALPMRLLIAPRHIERAHEVKELCRQRGFGAVLRSEISTAQGDEIIVLDTVGELAEVYAAADIAFVGGSLAPRGGHNVLEPVRRGVPVLFGPHVANFREAAALVKKAQLGQEVADVTSLANALEYYANNAEVRASIPSIAQAALTPHQGAAKRIAQTVQQCFKEPAQTRLP